MVSTRTPSSASTRRPPRPGVWNGAISPRRKSAAAAARACDDAANASWSSLLIPSPSPWRSVLSPIESRSNASRSPSCASVSTRVTSPSFWPARDPTHACGARLMDSCPTATTTWASPAVISRCACTTASMPDKHTALSVIAGTEYGTPAPTAACRAGF